MTVLAGLILAMSCEDALLKTELQALIDRLNSGEIPPKHRLILEAQLRARFGTLPAPSQTPVPVHSPAHSSEPEPEDEDVANYRNQMGAITRLQEIAAFYLKTQQLGMFTLYPKVGVTNLFQRLIRFGKWDDVLVVAKHHELFSWLKDELPSDFEFDLKFEEVIYNESLEPTFPIIWAIRHKQYELAEEILKHSTSKSLNAATRYYLAEPLTPLGYAVLRNDLRMVAKLLEKPGVDLNAQPRPMKMPPLFVAISRRSTEMVRYLLQMNLKPQESLTLLAVAQSKRRSLKERMNWVVRGIAPQEEARGPLNINAVDAYGMSVVKHAVDVLVSADKSQERANSLKVLAMVLSMPDLDPKSVVDAYAMTVNDPQARALLRTHWALH